MEKSLQDTTVRISREQGKSMKDRALFEMNASIGSYSWVNEYGLEKLGYSMEEFLSMSVFDLSPEKFHERLRSEIADLEERPKRFSVRPMRAASGHICWWYVHQTKIQPPVQWLYAEHIQDTPPSGVEFAFMSMQMDAMASQAALEARIENLDDWVRDEIGRLDGDMSRLHNGHQELIDRMDFAKNAASRAADSSADARNAAKAVQSELNDIVRRMEESQSRYTEEILKLISSNTLNDRRIQAFEDHVRATTELAVRTIESQADRSGRGLTRKVTIPVGVIAAVAAVIQIAIQHWPAIRSALVR